MPKTKTPKIRFEGFEDEWNSKVLGSLGSFAKGRGYSKSDLQESGTPIFLYGRIYTNFQLALKNVDTFAELKSGSLLSNGDEILVPSSGETPEDIAQAVALLQPGVILAGDLNIIRPSDGIDSIYLALRIGTGKVKDDLARKSQGKAVVHVSNSDLRELYITFPQVMEQQRISSFFSELDDTITAHRTKLAKLRQTKTSLLQKMFPQGDANEPELRFKGFTGHWERRRLTNEVDLYSGLTYSPSDVMSSAGTLVLRSSNVQGGEIALDDCVYVHPHVVDVDNIRQGDIIMVVRNGSRALIGKHALVKAEMSGTVIGAFMTGFRSQHPRFINALFDTRQFGDEVAKSMGATINQITGAMLAKMSFLFPEDAEQDAIGSVFATLDELIAAEQLYIEKLSQVKTSLLQKMFV